MMRMKITTYGLLVASLLAPAAALAQAPGQPDMTPAITAYNAGFYDKAAAILYTFIGQSGDPASRAKAEFFLAQSLEKAKDYQSAQYIYSTIIKQGTAHPYYVLATQGLVDVAEDVDDDLFIPALLSKNYNEEYGKLKPEYLHKVNYLVGMVAARAGQFQDALSFLGVVPQDSPYYARARYLLGVTTIQKGRKDNNLEKASQEALGYFQEVLNLNPFGRVVYTDLKDLRDLARLGLARTHYGLGHYSDAVKFYEEVPRFSEFWDQALFENGWARFLDDDLGGAIGSLQALHAPQFEGAFQPESWILKSTIYYTACLYDEAKGALDAYTKRYSSMKSVIQPLVDEDHEKSFYYQLITDVSKRDRLPPAVYNYLASNARTRGFLRYIASLEAEKKVINNTSSFKANGLQKELTDVIDQTRNLLESVTGAFVLGRLADVSKVIKGFEDQGEIIRFETAKAEKNRLESGVDYQAKMAAQKLLRPRMPGEDWEYWNFQGEYWIDEIGYYQFTLKSGCTDKEE